MKTLILASILTIIELLVLILVIELIFVPRIGIADGKWILWYGRKNRKYIFL